MSDLLTLDALTLRAGERTLCDDLSLKIEQGQRWGVLGRNGAGKTTLLHALAGLSPPAQGCVALDGNDLAALTPRIIAQHIGLLLQDTSDALPSSVLETALLGRHPHARGRLFDNAEDLGTARGALARLGIEHLADRAVASLSGGERQRLALATLLVQAPRLLLLDEPSNHLDVGFQSPLVALLRSASEEGKSAALVMATHDINLAARLCDFIVLMVRDGETLIGGAEQILTSENLSRAYDCNIAVVEHNGRKLFYPC